MNVDNTKHVLLFLLNLILITDFSYNYEIFKIKDFVNFQVLLIFNRK